MNWETQESCNIGNGGTLKSGLAEVKNKKQGKWKYSN